MIKPIVTELIQNALDTEGISIQVQLEKPKNLDHGDFATNSAFRLAGEQKKSPKLIADTLAETLNQNKDIANKMTIIPINGFLNIQLKDDYLTENLNKLKAIAKYPKDSRKIILEYVSANPTGPLHVGHGRWAILGDVMTRLLRHVGIAVDTEFYINDAGNQIQKFYQSVNAVKAGQAVPEDGYHGHYIAELAKSDADPVESMLKSQQQVLASVGITFDRWYSEKTLHQSDKISEAIQTLKDGGYTQEIDGALWFKSQELGDEKDRVLIKADGSYTYFAVDVAYHFEKVKRGYTDLINIWGADHHGYVARVRAALLALYKNKWDAQAHFKVIIGQLVSLKRDGQPVRLSKRSGEIITFEEVIEEIGADAVRYFLIEKSADTHLDFDLELAKKKSAENPVFYVQYAHARLCSILEKAEPELLKKSQEIYEKETLNTAITWDPKERQLIIKLLQFHDECWDSAQHLNPYRVAQYAHALAKSFHVFYEGCPILKSEPTIQIQRLTLVLKTKLILQTSLALMGISAPEQM